MHVCVINADIQQVVQNKMNPFQFEGGIRHSIVCVDGHKKVVNILNSRRLRYYVRTTIGRLTTHARTHDISIIIATESGSESALMTHSSGLPRSAESVQHTDNKLMRRHGLHDQAFVLNVADIGVRSELHLLQCEKLRLRIARTCAGST